MISINFINRYYSDRSKNDAHILSKSYIIKYTTIFNQNINILSLLHYLKDRRGAVTHHATSKIQGVMLNRLIISILNYYNIYHSYVNNVVHSIPPSNRVKEYCERGQHKHDTYRIISCHISSLQYLKNL